MGKTIRLAVAFAAVAALRASAQVEHVPGAPHPMPNVASDVSGCPLYFVEFDQRLDDGRLVLTGRLANAGPASAKVVSVEVHAMAKDGAELATFSAPALPANVDPGHASTFEVTIPLRDWERERGSATFAHSMVEDHVARCDQVEADRTDPKGNTRSSYRREAFSAAEGMTLLRHQIAAENPAAYSVIIRKRQMAAKDVPEMKKRLGELEQLLERDLPERAHLMGAPAEWLQIPR